jgi:putative spermidine/putrescine transport system substrate-binding protein
MTRSYASGPVAGLLMAFAFSPLALAQEVVVAVGTGDWAQANIKAYVEPFERETGIRVIRQEAAGGLAALRLQHESGNVETDVWNLSTTTIYIAGTNGWIQKIDYSLYTPEQLARIYPASRQEYGVGALYYSTVMTYNPASFQGRPVPSNWAEFWDVAKFPGRRTLIDTGGTGTNMGTLEIALMADGVAPDNLYPLDIPRAFRSLTRIRPSVVAWWRDGSDNQQLFADRVVDIGAAFNGRIGNLQKQGMDLRIEWNQGLLLQDFWAVAAKSRNSAAAQRFIAFALRPDRQADFVRRIPYGPTNAGAFDLIEPELGEQLPSHPKNFSRQVVRNDVWYAQTDASGKTNLQRVLEAWTRWSIR